MKLQLFSIDQAPSSLPIWQLILDDLGGPPPARVARVLGVGQRTVYRWNQRGHAPRSAALALYWLTRWGRSAVHTLAVNDALMAVQLAASLERVRDQLALLREQAFGAAAHDNTAIGLGAA